MAFQNFGKSHLKTEKSQIANKSAEKKMQGITPFPKKSLHLPF
jgi:hypothetical protein